jgi:DUF1365 family protein
MMYLDLAELPKVFQQRLFWSSRRPALAWFRRGDHLGDITRPLDHCVRDLVAEQGYPRPGGSIRLLTHLRYFGYVVNPVSFYYCYDKSENLCNIVAHVTNTPWGESHSYVLGPEHFKHQDPGQERRSEALTPKEFHVSPFMPMDLTYGWRLREPRDNLLVHINNYQNQDKFFDVTLNMNRRPINGWNLGRALIRYPAMTARVIAGIYWQALRLKWKGAKFYQHPKKNSVGGKDLEKSNSGNRTEIGETHAVVSTQAVVPQSMDRPNLTSASNLTIKN